MSKNFSFWKQVCFGKTTIYRAYFTKLLLERPTDAPKKVLDLASGVQSHYTPYLNQNIELTRTDIRPADGVTVMDFTQTFPFEEKRFDEVWLCNALYISENPYFVVKEAFRVLKDKGVFVLVNPYIYQEIKEPHDYARLTTEGITAVCEKAGFKNITITPMGGRLAAVCNLLHPFLFFGVIRAFCYTTASLLDKTLVKKINLSNPAPMGYFCQIKK